MQQETLATSIERTDTHAPSNSSPRSTFIAFACLSFFPLLYWIGSTLVNVLK